MVSVLVLLPALIALAMLNSAPAARVMLRVYLPCIMIVPMYLDFRLGGLELNVTSLVSLILAVIGLYTWSSTLKFTLLDACVLAYTISAFVSDALRHDVKLAMYAFLFFFSKCMCPYLIGRALIEQSGMRRDFVKVLVLCLAAVGIFSLWEYRMEANLFQEFVEKVAHSNGGWSRQTRWGFARIAGPYGNAIVAGMVFSTGLMLQLWLVGTKGWSSSKVLSFVTSRRKPIYITFTIVLGLFMTQSRGPWIGCAFGLILALIGFARNRRRAAVIALGTLTVAVALTSVVLDNYTNIDDTKTTDRDQLNASYRRELIATYTPLIAQGGMWGWGTPQALTNGLTGYVNSQVSIDNHYIIVAMWQGYFGIVLFTLMIALSVIHLVRLCVTLRSRDDMLFAYCMLGAIVASAFSVTTVALIDPMLQIFFLFLGWSYSIRPTRTSEEILQPVSQGPFAFRRVFA